MSQRLSTADVVQKRLVGTLCTKAARAADRRLHPEPVLILIERTDGCEDQIDRGIRTMLSTGSRRISHPAHELRQLSQLQALPVMVLLSQERPERLQMMCICPYRVRRSPQPMKVEKILIQHSDRKMLPVDDDPTQMSRVRNPDPLYFHHALPPEPGTSRHGRSSLRSQRPCRLIYFIEHYR